MTHDQISAGLLFLLGFAFGIIACTFLSKACAHTPCDDQQQPQCGYVQVVNPLSGELEQQYVCE